MAYGPSNPDLQVVMPYDRLPRGLELWKPNLNKVLDASNLATALVQTRREPLFSDCVVSFPP